jgi:hypothetical protein
MKPRVDYRTHKNPQRPHIQLLQVALTLRRRGCQTTRLLRKVELVSKISKVNLFPEGRSYFTTNSQSVSQSTSQSVSMSVGQPVSQLASQSVSQVSQLASQPASQSASQAVSMSWYRAPLWDL